MTRRDIYIGPDFSNDDAHPVVSEENYTPLEQLEGFEKASEMKRQDKHQTPPQVRSGNWETYGN